MNNVIMTKIVLLYPEAQAMEIKSGVSLKCHSRLKFLDSRFRGNDTSGDFPTFSDSLIFSDSLYRWSFLKDWLRGCIFVAVAETGY